MPTTELARLICLSSLEESLFDTLPPPNTPQHKTEQWLSLVEHAQQFTTDFKRSQPPQKVQSALALCIEVVIITEPGHFVVQTKDNAQASALERSLQHMPL